MGLAEEDPLVEDGSWLGDPRAWREHLKTDPEEMEQLRKWTRNDRQLGSEKFVARAERATSRRLRPPPLGRPKKHVRSEK